MRAAPIAAVLVTSLAALADAPVAQYEILNPQTASLQTVLDKRTRLEWVRAHGCFSAQTTNPACNWSQALAHCASLNANSFAGHADWRLPSIKELQTLVDRRTYWNKYIDPTAFNTWPNYMPNGLYDSAAGRYIIAFWSATPKRGTLSQAWFVDFGYGSVAPLAVSSSAYVRCVRTNPGS